MAKNGLVDASRLFRDVAVQKRPRRTVFSETWWNYPDKTDLPPSKVLHVLLISSIWGMWRLKETESPSSLMCCIGSKRWARLDLRCLAFGEPGHFATAAPQCREWTEIEASAMKQGWEPDGFNPAGFWEKNPKKETAKTKTSTDGKMKRNENGESIWIFRFKSHGENVAQKSARSACAMAAAAAWHAGTGLSQKFENF